MNFIKFYADSRPIAREKFVRKVQSSEFKVQMLCRGATSFIYWIATVALLPRDDKRLSVLTHRTFMTWVPRSASTHATRRAGPGPRDDKK